jgi:hypothetical protein
MVGGGTVRHNFDERRPTKNPSSHAWLKLARWLTRCQTYESLRTMVDRRGWQLMEMAKK